MSEGGKEAGEFIKHLQDEKLKTQGARSSYVTQKLAYATGLLALGSLKPGSEKLSLLLYLVPFLSIVFDLYILGEDYSVKRIGAFLGAASPEKLENLWEKWISKHRDTYARLAIPILTTLLAFAALLALLVQPDNPLTGKLWWAPYAVSTLAILVTWWLFFHYRKKIKEATNSAREVAKEARLAAMKNAAKALEEEADNDDERS